MFQRDSSEVRDAVVVKGRQFFFGLPTGQHNAAIDIDIIYSRAQVFLFPGFVQLRSYRACQWYLKHHQLTRAAAKLPQRCHHVGAFEKHSGDLTPQLRATVSALQMSEQNPLPYWSCISRHTVFDGYARSKVLRHGNT